MKRVAIGFALLTVFVCVMVWIPSSAQAQNGAYRSPEDIAQGLKAAAGRSGGMGKTQVLATTPGGRDVVLLELGKKDADLPGILVVANTEGDYPIASEAAVRLAELLAGDWSDELKTHKWYIIASGNPDGHANFFAKPLAKTFVNARPFNADNDDATDEDGPDDLNRDGFITVMRQEHPEGNWLPVNGNPVLMRKADEGKGEDGKYRLFPEGLDNDGDGEINEDGPGGVNPGRNFPHGFEHYTNTNGLWPASEVETRAILRFAFDHPEIAMVIVLGRSNSLKEVPEGGRRAEAGQNTYKVPERWANRFGLDKDKEYPIKELLDLARDAFGSPDLTEDQLIQWIGAGAAVNPDKNDAGYWKEISKRYNDFLKEAGFEAERLASPGFHSGSVQEWAYYQYGVPTFCMDFWTVPKKKKEEKKEDGELSADDIEKMSKEDFIALGEDKIGEIIKKSGAPEQFTAERVIKGLESGRMTTKRVAEFMRKSKDKDEEGGADEGEQAVYDMDPAAFVEWKPYNHPTLGKVEIGGMKPYADLTPPAGEVDSLADKQLPFLRDLVGLLPAIGIEDVQIKRRSAGVWEVEAWVTNKGFLPFPMHQGSRCERPTPTIVTIEGSGVELLEGKKRDNTGLLSGSGGVRKVRWLIQAADGTRVTIKAHSFSAGGEQRVVTLAGGGE